MSSSSPLNSGTICLFPRAASRCVFQRLYFVADLITAWAEKSFVRKVLSPPSTLTLSVEVKEPTEDEKYSGSDHPRRFNHISILLHSELGEEVNCSSQHTWRTIEYDVCDLAIQASTTNQSINPPSLQFCLLRVPTPG